jgi:micrococcal nuclease
MSARVRRRFPARPAWVLAILVVLIALRFVGSRDAGPTSLPAAESPHRVERIVDGDTLVLAGGVRVRLIGVDAPEAAWDDRPAEPRADEATAFVRDFIEGRDVRLEYDRERLDDYGRTLAYVFVEDRFLNEELIRAGLARAMTRFPYRSDRQRLFVAAEREAREHKRGIWGP